ncbi:MAG: hypothetical protein HY360_24810 [Verrucomicrobia bacterium]|nr:hypothetical protein [Verrucomicrobiota bacterium]
MHIFIPPGSPMDGSAYLAEILHAFGLCFAERVSLRDALKAANPHTDVILLPRGSETAGIESFLQAGGSVVAIQPDASVERLAALSRKKQDENPCRLRFVKPICYGARGEPLWTLGPIHVYENKPASEVAAYLFKPGDFNSESIGLWDGAVGLGQLVVYAYDPVLCMARLRQGFPSRANHLAPGEAIPRSFYLHEPHPPPDTAWRPTADLHAAALGGIIQRLLGRHAPVPSLWHIPEGRAAILIFSGDEDGGTQNANDQEMRDLESFDGALSLYVIPGITSITRQLIEEYTRRGHTISVHPNLTSTAGKPPAEQLAKAEQEVRAFHEKFAWPVRTIRNHSVMWPGYLDLPELWERLGIGMDANCLAALYAQSPDYGPYVNVDAAVPLRFVREDGSLIDVYQQPTHASDDVTSHPTLSYSQKYSPEQFDWIAQRIFDDAVRFFHAPICVVVHPCNYVSFSGGQGRALMARARELDMPIWSVDRWHDFWRARASWRMSGYTSDGTRLRFVLKGSPCESLSLTLPPTADGHALRSVTINGSPVQVETQQRYGQPTIQLPLPHSTSEVEVVVQYGQGVHKEIA